MEKECIENTKENIGNAHNNMLGARAFLTEGQTNIQRAVEHIKQALKPLDEAMVCASDAHS